MRKSLRQVLFGVLRLVSLATILVLGAAGPAAARPPRCAFVMVWTDANGCYHERWRYIDCETREWLGTVEIIYC